MLRIWPGQGPTRRETSAKDGGLSVHATARTHHSHTAHAASSLGLELPDRRGRALLEAAGPWALVLS